ncbi:MAG: hypothetical protein AAB592_06000 [Patescibacteria group bacterium]
MAVLISMVPLQFSRESESESTSLYHEISDPLDRAYAVAFDRLNLNIRPGTEVDAKSKESPDSLAHCKSVVYRTLRVLPREHRDRLKTVTLYFTEEGRRGLAGGNTMILRCLNISDRELSAVIVHETGHLVDTGLLNGSAESGETAFDDFGVPVYSDDPSVEFYAINWDSTTKKRANANNKDFCSTYGAADPFEDFAECYIAYRLQGKNFRTLAQSNKSLELKYNFLKKYVFNEKEFGDTAKSTTTSRKLQPYDATTVAYNLSSFWAER